MSHTNTTADQNRTPLQLAFQALLQAHDFTPPSQVRDLILEVDLTLLSFCLPANERECVTCPDEKLASELVFTASGLLKVPAESRDELLGEIEMMLAKHAPKSFIAYATHRKLWEDADSWNRTIGHVAKHIATDARHKLTAVLANEIFPEAVAA